MIPFPLLFSFASNSGNLGGSSRRRGNLYREVWVSERIFSHFARNPPKTAVFIIKGLHSMSGNRCRRSCMSMRARLGLLSESRILADFTDDADFGVGVVRVNL